MARDKKKQSGGTPANEKRPPEHPAALCGCIEIWFSHPVQKLVSPLRDPW
jgi:hypothetical protein